MGASSHCGSTQLYSEHVLVQVISSRFVALLVELVVPCLCVQKKRGAESARGEAGSGLRRQGGCYTAKKFLQTRQLLHMIQSNCTRPFL